MTDLYTQAGVNIDAGNRSVALFRAEVEATHGAQVLKGLGSFGALYSLKEIINQYQDPVLVQSIDGVGTKLSVAKLAGDFSQVGADIVNHSVNDILVMGAKPLTFLDYVAHAKLDPELMATIVRGMARACLENGFALVGGETAEMPGTYQDDEHDIAGAITGVVERSQIIDGSKIRVGDYCLGLKSSGLHTNGYSLARKILFQDAKLDIHELRAELNHRSLASVLLASHRSYLQSIQSLFASNIDVHGLVHITGGGFIENIPRILAKDLAVNINLKAWQVPQIFTLMAKLGQVSQEEMFRVFNMGIGMVVIVKPEDLNSVREIWNSSGEDSIVLGSVVSRQGSASQVCLEE